MVPLTMLHFLTSPPNTWIKGVEFVPKLPSWVPDLIIPSRPLPLHNLVQTVRFAAAASIQPDFEVSHENKLRLKAAIVDIIVNVGDGVDTNSARLWKPWTFLEIPTSLGTRYKPTGEPVISAFQKHLLSPRLLLQIPALELIKSRSMNLTSAIGLLL
ncbi:hypothetical protein BDZ94DRAFT_303264 [Collybia nuda]|uniref:Uncharacterized protein n=1 Tax=Collybia nuda TaxID=64659 RepID=A0A9P6CGX0_9AGAR|nr:hypothetical protein BDZ94DRAFT_303264 [Collybia nuda]